MSKTKVAPKIGSRMTMQDRMFSIIVYIITFLLLAITAYPMIYVLSSSFSDRAQVIAGNVVLFPVDFSIEGYIAVFKYPDIWTGYRNTIFYTVAGTIINIVVTMLAAYPMARRGWMGKKLVNYLFAFTMFFSGGMIPSYILMARLRLLNTVWAMLLPGAMSVYNMIIARTFIQGNIPEELFEAAYIDGAGPIQAFFKIVLPLSKAILAILTLYYAVDHWNAYFNAFIYLSDAEMYPLQLVLRDILIENSIDTEAVVDEAVMDVKQGMYDLLKYAVIVVSTGPIICVYPFVQRYFVKGVMIGSVKG